MNLLDHFGPPLSRNTIQVWHEALQVGKPLYTLPLVLSPRLAVPVDLQATHAQTCERLRIPAA